MSRSRDGGHDQHSPILETARRKWRAGRATEISSSRSRWRILRPSLAPMREGLPTESSACAAFRNQVGVVQGRKDAAQVFRQLFYVTSGGEKRMVSVAHGYELRLSFAGWKELSAEAHLHHAAPEDDRRLPCPPT